VQGFAEARARFGKVPEYDGLRDCVKTILRHEGVHGLYKGLVPSTIKVLTCFHFNNLLDIISCKT
jgi:hypothetical protein